MRVVRDKGNQFPKHRAWPDVSENSTKGKGRLPFSRRGQSISGKKNGDQDKGGIYKHLERKK